MAARMRGSWKTLGVVLRYGGIRGLASVSGAALAAASLTLGCSASTMLPPSEAGEVSSGEGMKRPEMISMGEPPKYSEEALAQRAEGLMVVRCTIDIEGRVRNCRVQETIPHMENAVLDSLYTRRYKPGTFNGKPVNVDYVFNIKLVLPPLPPPPPPPPSDSASTAPPSTGPSPSNPPSPTAPEPAAQEAAPLPPGSVVIPFGPGMNRPQLIAGKDPMYSEEALAERVEGLMIVRCTIDIEGRIRNCRVVKSLPHMEKNVLDALYSRRYTPVLYKGSPVNVDYVFNIKLVLPPPPAPPPPPSDSASTAPPSTGPSPPPPPSPTAPDAAAQGAAPPPLVNVVIPFGAGMSRPQMISGKDPIYSKEALAKRVEGLMIVRCTINIDGRITNCRFLKSLPHMDKNVLDALYSRRYTPVLLKGRPVNVDYVFNIKLVLPTRPAPPPAVRRHQRR